MSQYVVFDSHCDTASELWRKGQTLLHTDCMISHNQMKQFAGYGQFFAFCTLAGLYSADRCEELFWSPYHYFLGLLEQHKDTISLCIDAKQYQAAISQHKTAAFLSLEGAEGICCDPGRVEELHRAGITMVNLTWNENNPLAGCSNRNGPGLSRQGRDFVRNAQRCGIMVDVSHLSDSAFWDLMDITERPVVASHSNSRALCGHSRNLTDEQYLAICRSGGFVGINLYSVFLSDDGHADLDRVYRHMDHFLSLGGEHVALGGDLDGCDQLPEGFSGVGDYQKLAYYLENRGYSEETIENIFSKTMEKVVTLCTM